MKTIFQLTSLLCCMLLTSLAGAKTLANPPKDRSLMSRELYPISFGVSPEGIFTGFSRRDIALHFPFEFKKPLPQTDLSEHYQKNQRIDLPENLKNVDFTGAYLNKDYIYALVGLRASIVKYDFEKKEFYPLSTIIYDRIQPAADARGRATRVEISGFKAAFFKKIKNHLDLKLRSLAAIPNRKVYFNNPTKDYFLTLSAYSKQPLLAMSCPKADVSSCEIEQACKFYDGDLANEPDARLAYSAKRGDILISYPSKQLIKTFKFNNCFNIKKLSEIKVPERIKKLTDIGIESQTDSLWILSQEMDNYNNAHYQYWPSEQW